LAGGSARCKASTYTGQHNTEKRKDPCLEWDGFEPTIPVFERPKTVLALDCAVSGTGMYSSLNFIRTDKLRKLGWAVNVARMGR
jgi:hypothetical protein